MSHWKRLHLDDSVAALAIPDNHRFLVRLREPAGESRHPIEFFRWNLKEAKDAADKLVQEYYPHECEEHGCSEWQKLES